MPQQNCAHWGCRALCPHQGSRTQGAIGTPPSSSHSEREASALLAVAASQSRGSPASCVAEEPPRPPVPVAPRPALPGNAPEPAVLVTGTPVPAELGAPTPAVEPIAPSPPAFPPWNGGLPTSGPTPGSSGGNGCGPPRHADRHTIASPKAQVAAAVRKHDDFCASLCQAHAINTTVHQSCNTCTKACLVGDTCGAMC